MKTTLASVLWAALVLTACSSTPPPPSPSTPTTSGGNGSTGGAPSSAGASGTGANNTGATGGNSNNSGAAGSPSPPTKPAEIARARCATSRIAPATLRRLTRAEYENTIRDTFPTIAKTWAGSKLGPDQLSHLKFSNDANTLVVSGQTAAELLNTAKEIATLATSADQLPQILNCTGTGKDAACAAEFIDSYGTRLYRRPLTAEEKSELTDYYNSVASQSNFATGIQWLLVAMLQSPAVLYRSELGTETGKLTQHEIATELAYTYGGSTPSRELLAKANNNQLSSPAAILAEAKALQNTEAGKQALHQFFREWAGYEHVLGTSRDAIQNFGQLQLSMVQETRQWIHDIVFSQGGGIKDLLTARHTFLDSNLVSVYGFGTISGSGFTRVERPDHYGIGLLAQGSILAGAAHNHHSSPTFRGLLVYARLLCQTPEPPPASVPTIDMAPTAKTTRERYEKQHAQGSCAGCHKSFDPFGFALESFDEIGRYRATENGNPLDTSATGYYPDGSKLTFTGERELAQQLAAAPAVVDCTSGLLASYAFGGGGGQTCLAEEARTDFANGKYGLRELFAQFATAPSFTQRAR